MYKKLIILLLGTLSFSAIHAQNFQTVKGTVKEKDRNETIPYATIMLSGNGRTIGCTTDSLGHFALGRVPVGRYDLTASFVGYESVVIKELLVSGGKEMFVEVEMRESPTALEEVVVHPRINKQEPINDMALGGRMLSVEEAGRYAGAADDPARLVASFAGVAQNIGNNGITVRGNAPKFLQWRMEGVEIPNPNHFADVTSFGGGGFTALSSQVLGNSDFFTGAFPAEYSNALSGVFDMYMRRGSSADYRHAFQVGSLGIEAASEGPFKKGYGGSYLFNYRYSTLSLLSFMLPEDADGTDYQDLSFNIFLPAGKAGTFSLWGVGLIDRSGTTPETDRSKWKYEQDRQNQDVKQYMGAAGIKHKIYVGDGAHIQSTLAATANRMDMHTELVGDNTELLPKNIVRSTYLNFIASSYIQKRFSRMHTNRTGFRWTGLQYDLAFADASGHLGDLVSIADESGFSSLVNAYTESMLHFGDRMEMNIGIAGQWFTLNGHYTIEPRLSMKWKFAPRQSFSIAYGMHSRLEMLNYYFTKDVNGRMVNKDLDFTKAHHVSLGYDLSINENMHLRIEPYFQWLYDVPVIPGSTFSMINLQGNEDWFISDRLENEGNAMNYGVDITLERYMSQGFYYMATASLYDSKYRTAGNGKWFNSRYNRHFTVNLLAGKEWMLGRNRQNILGLSGKITMQGGDRYSPIDTENSVLQQDAVYDESNPYSCQFNPMVLAHLTVSYRLNCRKVSHEFAAKLINVTGYKDYYGHRYNFIDNTVEAEREANILPNISYKIYF